MHCCFSLTLKPNGYVNPKHPYHILGHALLLAHGSHITHLSGGGKEGIKKGWASFRSPVRLNPYLTKSWPPGRNNPKAYR